MTMRKKNRQNCPKSGLSLLVLLVGTSCFVGFSMLSGTPDSRAVAQENEQFVRCGHASQIALPLSDLYQSVQVQQSGVVCAFRHKIKGFPIITIIQEPPGRPQNTNQKVRDIESSYHLVGLTDAVILEPRLKNISGIEALEVRVRYTSQGAAMEAFVAVLEGPDRTYTVTALFRAQEAPDEKNDLISRIERLHVDNVPPIQEQARSINEASLYTVLGALLLLVTAVIVRAKLRKKEVRS